MPAPSRILLVALSVALFWMAAALPSQASSVLPIDLSQIVGGAQTAFQGICTDNHSERDAQSGMIVTYTTFNVTDVLKGTVGATHTIKQIGGKTETEGFHVSGIPSFAVGQEYVVFLYGVSSAGFSSPVGLSQGKFVVTPGANGAEISNGRDFKEMLPAAASLPQSATIKLQQTPGELKKLQLDEFKQIVRQQSGGAK